MTQGSTPPGWYDDGQGAQRWWDGTQWTEHTQPAPGAPETPAETPAATPPAEPPKPGVHDDITRFGTAPPADGGGSSPAASTPPSTPSTPSTPSADVTMVAPNRGAGAPGQQPGYTPPATPGYGTPAAGGYTPPGQAPGGQPGQPGQFGGAQPPAWQNQFPASGGSSGGGKGKLFALIGGGVALLVVVLIILFVFVLGGGGGPKGAAEDYLEAASDFDFERVCELSTKDAIEPEFEEADVDSCKGLGDYYDEQFKTFGIDEFQDDLEIDVEIDDVKEDGDKATVEYTVKSKYTGDDEDGFREFTGEDSLENEETGTLDMVKEDGDWKVSSGL